MGKKSKLKTDVNAASVQDIDELVRRHETSGAVSHSVEASSSPSLPYVSFLLFAVVATAVPIYLFTTPIFDMSLAKKAVQFGVSGVVSVLFLVLCYSERTNQLLRGLKGKKRVDAELDELLTSQAANTAIFRINMLYVVFAVISALYLLPLYGSSEAAVVTLSVAGPATLLLAMAKVF